MLLIFVSTSSAMSMVKCHKRAIHERYVNPIRLDLMNYLGAEPTRYQLEIHNFYKKI
jgi:hypothetical protein